MAFTTRVVRIEISDDNGAGPVRADFFCEISDTDPVADRVHGKRNHTLTGSFPRAAWNQLIAAGKAKVGAWPKSDVPMPVTEDP